MTPKEFTVIRVHGEFTWPPEKPDPSNTVKGTVSIEYHPLDATLTKFSAWLRWDPLITVGKVPSTPSVKLPDFASKGADKLAFHLPLKDVGKKKLSFVGGWFYEQSSPKAPNSSGEILTDQVTQFPLADNAQTRKKPTLHATETQLNLLCRLPKLSAIDDHILDDPNSASPSFSISLKAEETLTNLIAKLGALPKDYVIGNEQVDQPRALLAILKQENEISDNTKSDYRVTFESNSIRHWFGPLSARHLSNHGILRSQSQLLVIALDGSDHKRIHSRQGSFYLAATMAWSLSHDDFWKSIENKDGIQVSLVPEVAWNPSSLEPISSLYTPHGLLRAADESAMLARSGLRTIDGGLIDCALPACDKLSASEDVNAYMSLRFPTFAGRQVCGLATEKKNLEPITVGHSISLLSSFPDTSRSNNTIAFDASFPLLAAPEDQPGHVYKLQLQHGRPDSDLAPDGSRILLFFEVVEPKPASKPLKACIGGLAFSRTSSGLLVQQEGKCRSFLTISLPPDEKLISQEKGSPKLRVEWDLSLAVDEVVPKRGDLSWGDREHRTLPLLVRSAAKGAPVQNSHPFILRVTEFVSPRDDRHLVGRLLENSADTSTSKDSYTLLSRHPWGVLRFAQTRLTRVGDEENATIAIFDSDQRFWQFKLVEPEYHFQFPPQGIGESADKPRVLELHDVNALVRVKDNDVQIDAGKVSFIRPVPAKSVDAKPRRSYVVETRFTPSLDLWVRPSDLDRNYFLAQWNAYELFRQRNDFGLGVALRALRGEFLYGMAVGIDPSRESGISALARVAEIEAITGRLPAIQYVTQHTDLAKTLIARWRLLRNALLARHERLEIWSPTYDEPRPFSPSRFAAGATFGLRTTALHRAPTLPKDGEEFAKSGPGQLRIDKDHGLSGGAIWPIEFRSFWEALRAEPTSQGGNIERIAIGPTGGDADQSARFLKDLLTIASSTRAGFVQRQRVEILGRIGVFWNRAKHVVIYERTVNPSEQFAPEIDDENWYQSRSRRAVVRKVTEYIELLEPVRSYPDDPNTSATTAAFLDSSRFQKIIFVDSAWGQEIDEPITGAKGYVIPLWNPNAARQRPNVYQFPNVTFVTIGEGKEDRPLIPRQCANPENLFFYSQASPLEGDTNRWEPVFDVDYGHLLDPLSLEQKFAAGGANYGMPTQDPTNDVPEGRKPSPQRVMPGQHRFTWRLLPDSGRTMINATYSDKPVYGNLESITFSRGLTALAAADANLEKHYKHSTAIATLSLGPGLFSRQLADLKQLRDEIEKEPAGSELPTGDRKTLLDAILSDFDKVDAQLTGALSHINDLTTEGEKITDAVGLKVNPLDCDKLKKRLAETVDRKVLVIAHQIDDRQQQLEKLIDAWTEKQLHDAWKLAEKAISDPKARLTRALSELLITSGKLKDLLTDAQTDVDKVLGEMEIATRILHDAFADLDTALARGAQRIQDCLAACSEKAEWTADRYSRLREQIREELNGLTLQLNSVVSDLCQRLGAELGPFGWSLGKRLSSEFSQELTKIINEDLKLAIAVTFDKFDKEVIKKINSTVAICVDKIQTARNALAQAEADLRKMLYDADKDFRAAVSGLESKVRTITSEVLSSAAVVPALLNEVANSLLGRIDEVYSQAKELSEEELKELKASLKKSVPRLGELISRNASLQNVKQEMLDEFKKLCDALREKFNKVVGDLVPKDLKKYVNDRLDILREKYKELKDAAANVDEIKKAINGIEKDFSTITVEWNNSVAAAQTYTTHVMEGFSRVAKGNIKSTPNNVLKLMAAATAAPEIGQLQANVNRMRCAYDDIKLRTSKIRATLGKLGDALKAMGIDIPTDALSGHFEIPQDIISKFDITRLFPNFGGLNLRNLLPDVKVPDGVKDAVKISHDFDRKQFRAWVQVDVNVPIQGRKELYSFGPFAVYFRDTTLTGIIRAEASKDSEETQTTARSEIATHIDIDISGARILSLEKVFIRYAQGEGMKFEFDPKSIRLHAALQFVQDTLGDILGDEIGGMKILKEQGIPIGIEHEFSLPTISLMAGTSGISNIQLSNLFRLVAYPDFLITNRFNLSKPELPFIFSFFIVGGTGYIIIDASYRPLDQSLTVGVEVAIGGSASLGFAFGPVRGSVFIALSLVITYRKTISGPKATGEGLTVSFQLVIAGSVSLWGIIDVYLGLLLRMSYQEGGAIDALGSLSVSVKICRFITLRFSTTVQYRLRNGRSEKTVTSSTVVSEGDRIKELKEKSQRLQGARK